MTTEKYPDGWVQSNKLQHKIVLAIDPTVRGIGFAVFRGPHEPLDWGTTDIRLGKNLKSMMKIRRLVKIYEPDVMVCEDTGGHGSYRCKRIKNLIASLSDYAKKHEIDFVSYSPDQVKEVFSNFGVATKYSIAEKISHWLPEFESTLPDKRKCYQTEHLNYGIFDALALALTYFYLES